MTEKYSISVFPDLIALTGVLNSDTKEVTALSLGLQLLTRVE